MLDRNLSDDVVQRRVHIAHRNQLVLYRRYSNVLNGTFYGCRVRGRIDEARAVSQRLMRSRSTDVFSLTCGHGNATVHLYRSVKNVSENIRSDFLPVSEWLT